MLRSEPLRRAVDALRGYDAEGCGRIETFDEACALSAPTRARHRARP